MKIILWIIQVLLALWNIIGAIFMINNYKALASTWALNSLPQTFWIILGALQILFSLGLIFSGFIKKFPKLTSISALAIVIISLLGLGIYTSYAGSGSIWALTPAVLGSFVAYKRWPTNNN
jgi:hypothetical protein